MLTSPKYVLFSSEGKNTIIHNKNPFSVKLENLLFFIVALQLYEIIRLKLSSFASQCSFFSTCIFLFDATKLKGKKAENADNRMYLQGAEGLMIHANDSMITSLIMTASAFSFDQGSTLCFQLDSLQMEEHFPPAISMDVV